MTAKLTNAQKRELATCLIVAAGDLLEEPEQPMTLPRGMDRQAAARQLAVWLKNLPGDRWDNRLPRPEEL